jgi:hypothetical protein
LSPNAESSRITRIPSDDLVNLIHQVVNHEEELTEQTKIIKKLEQRVSVLEKDVKTLIYLCQRLRLFAHLHPGVEKRRDEFDVALAKLLRRYEIPLPE